MVTGKVDVRHQAPDTMETGAEELAEGLEDEQPEEEAAAELAEAEALAAAD